MRHAVTGTATARASHLPPACAIRAIGFDGDLARALSRAIARLGARLQELTRAHRQLDLLCAKPPRRRALIGKLPGVPS